MEIITSRQNPRIKALVRLRDKRERQTQGEFLIEGLRETKRALDANIVPTALVLCPEHIADDTAAETLIRCLPESATVYEVSTEVFAKISMRDSPDGILLVARTPATSLDSLQLPPSPLLLIVEGVEKPGNLGALIRSADAAGAAALICADPLTDFFNPHVIRNSQGAVFSLPCVADTSPEVLSYLRKQGIRLVATTPDTPSLLWDSPLTGAIAIAVGSESQGLSPQWLDQADTRLRIPMHGGADSLNVSVSAALCLYEAVRQRR